ncbi:histone-lysine n-methyltransferase [Moniliophthora roreri]|nr:histone-lysine n-methyltransferase [Moniliophthora roreri]
MRSLRRVGSDNELRWEEMKKKRVFEAIAEENVADLQAVDASTGFQNSMAMTASTKRDALALHIE